MRALLLGVLLSLLAVGGRTADLPAAPAAQREDAEAVARAVEAHYKHAVTLRAVFLETYNSGETELRMESGTVYFRRPGLMRWDYTSPQKKFFLVDGHYAWFYIPADHTASRASARKSADWRTPFALLTGKARLSDLCRGISVVPNQGGPSSPPAGDVVLDCAPKHKEAFLDAQIEVDRTDRIVNVLVKQPGDVSVEVRFGNWEENIPLSKSLFRFQPPPGVTVVDQQALAGSMD
ncbi:MAG TPA: outer-membrane lipoprotein carrier protein LolA [Candidatus Dormibacteraeota bacterium]|nr:outer-membrane lipoprotein carrier protein LolA [Candidatus Dormibacteraeota bacterium]